jgi:predicted O-methyltransferase YrrM
MSSSASLLQCEKSGPTPLLLLLERMWGVFLSRHRVVAGVLTMQERYNGRTMEDLVDAAVRNYLASLTTDHSALSAAARERSRTDHIPAVRPETASFLYVLASLLPARRIFEIGTGYGVSGIAVMSGAADSVLFTVERDAARSVVAREHFEQAGLASRANVMIGSAARLVHKVAGPFDLIVQDGDAALYGSLLDRLVALLRPGGVLVSDHILCGGDVVPGFTANSVHSHECIDAIATYNTRLAADPRLRTAFLPIGDGIAVSVRVEKPS